MKKPIKKLMILIIGLLLPIGYISSREDLFADFTGLGHSAGCHDTEVLTISSIGTVNLTSSAVGAVSPGSEITISATIKNFTEAAGQTVTLGFSSLRSDNGKFGFAPVYIGSLSINGTGHAITQNFIVTAPTSGGNFTITADTFYDSTGGGNLTWAYSSMVITVEGSSNGDPPPDDLLTAIIIIGGTMSGIGILAVQIVLSTKFLKQSKKSKERESNI